MGLTAAQAAEIIDATPNAVYRLVAKGALAKPVKHQHGGLQLEDVEAASLRRYRAGRGHPYGAAAARQPTSSASAPPGSSSSPPRDGCRSSSTVAGACTAAPSSR